MEKRFENGCAFTVNEHGQKVDEDGFKTSETTFFTGIRWCCVSVKIGDSKVQVRDTKDPSKTTLVFNNDEWRAFVEGVKKGRFDV